jgi:hypothetical protein
MITYYFVESIDLVQNAVDDRFVNGKLLEVRYLCVVLALPILNFAGVGQVVFRKYIFSDFYFCIRSFDLAIIFEFSFSIIQ